MATFEHLNNDPLTGRSLTLVDVAEPTELPEALQQVSGSFVCLIAWDSSGATIEEVIAVAEAVVSAGAAYVCCWGAGCELVHDVVDEVLIDQNSARFVQTTWHSDEPLSDVLWFGLNCASPDDEWACSATLAICIGNPTWGEQVRAAFRDPRGFSDANLD